MLYKIVKCGQSICVLVIGPQPLLRICFESVGRYRLGKRLPNLRESAILMRTAVTPDLLQMGLCLNENEFSMRICLQQSNSIPVRNIASLRPEPRPRSLDPLEIRREKIHPSPFGVKVREFPVGIEIKIKPVEPSPPSLLLDSAV